MRRMIIWLVILLLLCCALYLVWLLIDTIQEEQKGASSVSEAIGTISSHAWSVSIGEPLIAYRASNMIRPTEHAIRNT